MKSLKKIKEKNLLLSEKEMNNVKGGESRKYIIENQPNILGLPNGIYIHDLDTGVLYNILGKPVAILSSEG
jgi:hypothetical protein